MLLVRYRFANKHGRIFENVFPLERLEDGSFKDFVLRTGWRIVDREILSTEEKDKQGGG